MSEKPTEPKFKTEGVTSRSNIKEGMSNHPKGTDFKPIFYTGKLQPTPK
jgi:hypothetical protein